jgi:hypothetical protein
MIAAFFMQRMFFCQMRVVFLLVPAFAQIGVDAGWPRVLSAFFDAIPARNANSFACENGGGIPLFQPCYGGAGDVLQHHGWKKDAPRW